MYSATNTTLRNFYCIMRKKVSLFYIFYRRAKLYLSLPFVAAIYRQAKLYNNTAISLAHALKLYLKQAREMTAIRITTAIPENNIATAMLPGGYPIVNGFRFQTNRRQAFDSNRGGTRPKVWNSTSHTSAQVRLPIDEIGAIAAGIFTARPYPMRPSRLTQGTPEAAISWDKANEVVRKKIQKEWEDWEYPLLRIQAPLQQVLVLHDPSEVPSRKDTPDESEQELPKSPERLVEPGPGPAVRSVRPGPPDLSTHSHRLPIPGCRQAW